MQNQNKQNVQTELIVDIFKTYLDFPMKCEMLLEKLENEMKQI